MTCIVAGNGWMAADRRITNSTAEVSTLVKIAQNRWLIAAASGNATTTLDVKRAIRKGAQLVEDLIEHVDRDSSALVMTLDGRVFKVEDERVWSEPPGLGAIGSGGDLALGWLSRAEQSALGVERTDIRQAFEFVQKRRADCGGGVDIRYLRG